MIKALVLSLAHFLLLSSAMAATPFYKCNANGAVQYQQTPCASDEAAKPPTVADPNAERQRHVLPSKEKPSNLPLPTAAPAPALAAPDAPHAAYRCDGRTYCSQMHSCAEANYFLANCPGVKMDGDGDGIPCEEQWCHP
jgi:hypothetical protein